MMLDSTGALRAYALLTMLFVACAALAGCTSFPPSAELRAMAAAYPGGPPPSAHDGRARYRQLYCTLVTTRAGGPSDAAQCDDLLWRLRDEPAGGSAAVELPEFDRRLRVFVVSGAFSDCRMPATVPFEEAIAQLSGDGVKIAPVMVSGRSGTTHNARQIADALRGAGDTSREHVVLVGYSKGAIDILEFLVSFPELARQVTAVVSVAGAVQGSPLADDLDWWYQTFLADAFAGTCDPGDAQVMHSLRPATRKTWFETHALPDHVDYYSLAGFTTAEHMSRGLKPAWRRLAAYDPRNDGQVAAGDAVIPGATLLGYVNADHWDMAISLDSQMPQLSSRASSRVLPRSELLHAALLYVSESLATTGLATASQGEDAR